MAETNGAQSADGDEGREVDSGTTADRLADAEEHPDDENMSEKESRLLWLSTMHAISYMEKQQEYKYILDDRRRARVVREKYWRIVRDAAVLSQRTGVEIFLASGRPTPGPLGLKQHVFASAGLCNPENQCMHDAASKMAETWTSSLAAYREALIVKNKEKDNLIHAQQARFLADQRQIQEKQQLLDAAIAESAALRSENERLRAQAAASSGQQELPDV
ncbi:hypothetical protein V8E36_007296 [Tilletia maclaganii]